MSLAAILYPSPTQHGWKEWSWHNFQHHLGIDEGLRVVKGLTPNVYRLWPVEEHEFRDWLEQHQQAHSVMNQALGISGQDLSGLDLNDKRGRDGWFYQHFIQHQAAAKILGLPIL